MSATRTCIAVALVAVAITGCSPRSATLAAFSDRSPLSSCGELVLGHGETVPAAAIRCMDETADGEGAELSVSMLTTEGDRIVAYLRVGPQIDGLDRFVDGTADSFGPGTWTYQHCVGDVTISEFGTCTARRAAGEPLSAG